MQFYFIRHAQSENNALWDQTGADIGRKEDPSLTELGWEQARRVAGLVAGLHDGAERFGVTHLYCSPMLRAVATAYEIGKQAGLMPVLWKDWHECGGLFSGTRANNDIVPRPGMSKQVLEERFPGIVTNGEVGPDGWWQGDYELEEERSARGTRVVERLLEIHAGTNDVVAVVSHGAFYQRFVAALMGIEKVKPIWFLMNNTGVTRVDFNSIETTLVYSNSLQHLPSTMVS